MEPQTGSLLGLLGRADSRRPELEASDLTRLAGPPYNIIDFQTTLFDVPALIQDGFSVQNYVV